MYVGVGDGPAGQGGDVLEREQRVALAAPAGSELPIKQDCGVREVVEGPAQLGGVREELRAVIAQKRQGAPGSMLL